MLSSFVLMLQFLCLQMCVYGGSVVPQGGLGTVTWQPSLERVVGDRLPWGGRLMCVRYVVRSTPPYCDECIDAHTCGKQVVY